MDMTATWRFFRPALAPLGWAMRGIGAARASLYASGLLPGWTPPVPCISVGNIAMGGSGKTPLTQWLLHWACARGVRPVVLTRGYGARPPHLPYLVTPGSTAAQAGDEPLLLASGCPGGHVVVDPLRRRSGPWAMARLHPDLFVLDDGFQHLAVRRHLDLVLLRPADLEQDWDRVVPAGYWREGAPALRRAMAFLVKASPERFAALAPALERRLGGLGLLRDRPVFSFELRATGLRRLDGHGVDLQSVRHGEWLLASGIADPAQAAESLTALLGRPPAAIRPFPDHHAFTTADVAALRALAAGRLLVVTPKDAVKLAPLAPELLTVDLELRFGPSPFAAESFPEYLAGWWRRQTPASTVGC